MSFYQTIYDLNEIFPKFRRTSFGCMNTFLFIDGRVVYTRSDTRKCGDGTFMSKTCNVSNLSYQLRPRDEPTPFIDMTTGYLGSFANVSFIKARSSSIVLEAALSCSVACLMVSLVKSFFGSTETSSLAALQISFVLVVLLSFIPFLIMGSKCVQGHFTNTVHIPVGSGKIHPFLTTTRTGKAIFNLHKTNPVNEIWLTGCDEDDMFKEDHVIPLLFRSNNFSNKSVST